MKGSIPRLLVERPSQLVERLAELEQPPLGAVRVYRGQNRPFPRAGEDTLVAALHRDSRPTGDSIAGWTAAASSATLAPEEGREIELEHVWLPALLQHYGPGSYFLDVTSDLDVALWFALNAYQSKDTKTTLMINGVRVSVTLRWAWYVPIRACKRELIAPVIYVFDVFRWPGFAIPAHGDLVAVRELSVGQRISHRATRLHRQSAYLLYASPRALSGPNLAVLLTAVISMPPILGGRDALSAETLELFPPPSLDPCYASLVSVPLARAADSTLHHPLALLCYVSSAEAAEAGAESDDFLSRIHHEPPT